MKAAIIEVALNESMDTAVNPHAPYTVDEIVADAVETAAAGATIIHFHARNADGSQAPHDSTMCREIIERVRERSDVLLYPTYFPGLPAETRMAHIWRLLDEPTRAPLEIVDLVPSRHVGRVLVDARTGAFRPSTTESGPAFPEDWTRIDRAGCIAHLGVLEMADLRYVIQAARAGLIPRRPLLLRFVLSQEMVWGFFPTPSGLDAMLSQIPEWLEWLGVCAVNFATDGEAAERLLRHALGRGLGIRVGVGDQGAAWPRASNADMVLRAKALIAEAGREPASPSALRTALGLKPA